MLKNYKNKGLTKTLSVMFGDLDNVKLEDIENEAHDLEGCLRDSLKQLTVNGCKR